MAHKKLFFLTIILFAYCFILFEKIFMIPIPGAGAVRGAVVPAVPKQPTPVIPSAVPRPPVVPPGIIAKPPVAFSAPVQSMPIVAQSVPTAIPIAPVAAPSAPVAVVGAQTIDLPEQEAGQQGNWLKKREWLKHSQEVYEEIVKIVQQVEQSKKSFYDRYVSVDNELDNFYRECGFKQGKLQDLFDDIDKYLEKKRKKDIAKLKAEDGGGIASDLEIKIDIVDEKTRRLKNDLTQLQFDMKSIEELDSALSDRLKKVDEQIKVALDIMEKAKTKLDQIWLMIDDRKARAAYYELNGDLLEKVKAIKVYLLQDLSANFDTVLSTIRSQISQIKISIKALENKGLIVVDRAKKIEELRLNQLEDLEAGRPLTPELKIEKKEEEKPKTWFSGTYDFFVDLGAKIYGFYKSVAVFFLPEKKVN